MSQIFQFGTPRAANNLNRKSKKLEKIPRIIIACEGEKTEPLYFQEMCRNLGIASAIVEIIGKECNSAPISIANYAVERMKADNQVDEIYCVFDRDRHETFDAAMNKIASYKTKIKAIVSYPCFEYWFYIHFKYSRSPIIEEGKNSPGAIMLSRLIEEVWPSYKKGVIGSYAHLTTGVNWSIEKALRNAKKAREDASVTSSPNPSTDVDVLYLRLVKISKMLPNSLNAETF